MTVLHAIVSDAGVYPSSVLRTRARRALLVAARLLRLALACFGALLLVLLFTPIPDWLVEPLVARQDLTPSDAIVLFAAWASPDGFLNDPGLRRSVEAARLYREGVAPRIVVSGRNLSEGSGPTSQVMANLLVDLGVPRDAVRVETDSTNTHETAVNIARLGAEQHWQRVTLVSDGRHMRRALAVFRHEGLAASPGTSMQWDLRTTAGPYRLWQFGATAHEWGGLVYYWWKGWI